MTGFLQFHPGECWLVTLTLTSHGCPFQGPLVFALSFIRLSWILALVGQSVGKMPAVRFPIPEFCPWPVGRSFSPWSDSARALLKFCVLFELDSVVG